MDYPKEKIVCLKVPSSILFFAIKKFMKPISAREWAYSQNYIYIEGNRIHVRTIGWAVKSIIPFVCLLLVFLTPLDIC